MDPLTSIPFSTFSITSQVTQGTLTLSDGSTYVGDIINHQPHGRGTLTYSSSDGKKRKNYVGQFVEGKRQGEGIITYLNGATFKGSFDRDEATGYCETTWKEPGFQSITFKGIFSRGVKQGNGNLTWMDSKGFTYSVTGFWMNGNLETGTKTYDASDPTTTWLKYTGPFQNDLPHGRGVVEKRDGYVYNGDFKEGKFDGYGTEILNTPLINETFRGNYKQGQRYGEGKLERKEGLCTELYEGTWEGEFRRGKFRRTFTTGLGTNTEGGDGEWRNGTLWNGKTLDGHVLKDGSVSCCGSCCTIQ